MSVHFNTQQQHILLTTKLPPKTSNERFVYFGLVDPRCSPLAHKMQKIALIALAALFCVVTLGIGAVLVKKLCQINQKYQQLLPSMNQWGKALLEQKFLSLSKEVKDRVSFNVYTLAGVTTEDRSWGEKHALDNVQRLIQALRQQKASLGL